MKCGLLVAICIMVAGGGLPLATRASAADAPSPVAAAPAAPRIDLSAWTAEHRQSAVIFAVACGVIVLGTAIMLLLNGRRGSSPYITKLSPSFFFWLEIGYLVLLLLMAAFYLQVTPPGAPAELLGGVLPIGVPWFGAVGAVVISLEGIFAYGQRDWDPKFNYWHIGRPLFGAVLGIVAFFTYLLIIMSAGAVPPFIDAGSHVLPAAKDYIVYYIVAFLVGYREETFRELIRRVTDLILKPGSGSEFALVSFKRDGAPVSSLDFGSVSDEHPVKITVSIENTGKVDLRSPVVSLTASPSVGFTVSRDTVSGSAILAAGEARLLDIALATSGQALPFEDVLTVTGGGLRAPAKLTLVGRCRL